MIELNQSDAVPLYRQLHQIIRGQIVRGELGPNERLPSESELSQMYGVSRVTIRNAINELAEENLLVKKQGKGTFVRSNKIERDISQVLGFTEICRMSGMRSGTRILSCEVVDAGERDVELLRVAPGDKVIRIRRVRLADEVPVILETVWFVSKYSDLMLEDLKNDSIYRLLREKYGVQLIHSQKSIEMTFATEFQAQQLEVAEGYPMILIRGFVLDNRGEPVHRTDQYIVGDKFKLYI